MKYKFGIHAANYRNDSLLVPWINNVGSHADAIFLAYPTGCFGYNAASRADPRFKNHVNPDLIQSSRFPDKVTIVRGDWSTEEEQRNDVCDKARAAGCDYLIVQDIDEFFTPTEMERNLRGIHDSPNFLLYKCPWSIFWKTVRLVLEMRAVELDHGPDCRFHATNSTVTFSTAFCINLRAGARFYRARSLKVPNPAVKLLPGLCCHLAWVHSDNGVQTKINTWVHSQEVRRQWYRLKWLNWRPESRWLSYSNPLAWNRAVPFTGELPVEIATYDPGPQEYSTPSPRDLFEERAYDYREAALFFARQAKQRVLAAARLR